MQPATVYFLYVLACTVCCAYGALEVQYLMDEGTGDTLTDSAGDTTAIISNYASSIWTTDSIGGFALDFDGTKCARFLNVIGPENNWTITFWMKTAAVGPGVSNWYTGWGLVDAEVAGVVNDFGTAFVSTRVVFGTGNPDNTMSSLPDINNGEWHYVSAVRYVASSPNRSVTQLYIDGTLSDSFNNYVNFGPLDSPADITIGCLQTNIQYFVGIIDNVRIYSHALSSQDIFTEMVTDVPERLTTTGTTGMTSSTIEDSTSTTGGGSTTDETQSTETNTSPEETGNGVEEQEESKGSNSILIVILSIVGAVIACGFCIAVFIVVRKRGKKASHKKPAWRPIAFGSFLALNFQSNYDEPLKDLEMIIANKEMQMAQVIQKLTSSTEIEPISKSMVFILESHGQAIQFIQLLIDIEVKSAADNVSTLFRANTMVSSSITAYFKMVGWEYLWEMLSWIITELDQQSQSTECEPTTRTSGTFEQSLMHVSVEVDPMKMTEDDDVDLNILHLQFVAQKLLKSIITSEAKMPMPIRIVLSYVVNQIKSRFPQDEKAQYISIGSFLFLRFICPSLVSPHVYGLLENPPSEKLQRTLILLSKLLQNIANDTRAAAKEPFMAKLNDFVNSNVDKVKSFYGRIITTTSDSQTPSVDVPESVKVNSLVTVHHSLVNNKDKMEQKIEDLGFGPIAFNLHLHEVLDRLGSPRPRKA